MQCMSKLILTHASNIPNNIKLITKDKIILDE